MVVQCSKKILFASVVLLTILIHFQTFTPTQQEKMKKFIGYAFFAYFLECSEGILIPFPFQTLKKERIRGKEVEDALYSKRSVLFNATTITSVVVVGTHLTSWLSYPHSHTPSQVSTLKSQCSGQCLHLLFFSPSLSPTTNLLTLPLLAYKHH